MNNPNNIPGSTSPQGMSSPVDSPNFKRQQKRQYPRTTAVPGYSQQLPNGSPSLQQLPQAGSPYRQPSPYQQQMQPNLSHLQPQQPHFQQPGQFQQPGRFQPSGQFQQPEQFQLPEQFQQPGQFQQSAPIMNNATNGYNQVLNDMSSMNIHHQPSHQQNIPLVGQPPLIQDLHVPNSTPTISPNYTATNSVHAQVHACFNHSTVNKFPFSNSLVKKSKLPLGLILQPYLSSNTEKVQVPVVPDTTVARCSRCKTYINPFIRFSAGTLQWKCNMCNMDNDVPPEFDWDVTQQQHADRYARPELNYGCVDFIAPAEYTIRPPQPPAYVFVLDVSFTAVQSGMLPVVADAILASLDKLPNEDGRAKVAFLTADGAVGFHKLCGENNETEMLVVADLTDMYLPRAASDLIVNLAECKSAVEGLLEKIKTMFNATHAPNNCLGSALQAARKLLSPTGGKIVCFQASIPSVGDGTIKLKPELQHTSIDTPMMTISNSFYKTFAGECTKSQVCADMFIFGQPNTHADVVTLNAVPRSTGGQTRYYSHFSAQNPSECTRLREEVIALLSEQIGLEAVMRTRCSSGIVCRSFYGNCTTRDPDIMALPNVPRDQSYSIELHIEEDIQTDVVHFQTALLYTTCFGERRIRVMNLCLPVTKSVSDLYSSVNATAVARILCHQAVDKATTHKLRDGREVLCKGVIDIMGAYSKEMMGSVTANNQLAVCKELSCLPILLLSLLKLEAFNDAATIPTDVRAQCAILLRTLPTSAWLKLVHPNFYSIHNMPLSAGTVDAKTGQCVMPPPCNLSSEKLESHGCYMIENGQHIYIWVGKAAVPQLCQDLLGVTSVNEIKSREVPTLPALKSPISERLGKMVRHLQTNRQVTYYPTIFIIKEDEEPILRSRFLNQLVEDRQPTGPTTAGANQQTASSGMSYFQWLGYIRSKMQ